ncbi:hypothetical protein K525DRAFT_274079 [Schizophyllum commune Loenen D]|nr:hypothetical protein K525DRAFT_274079 [Schizophyllum commune Loenen D]
MASAIIAWIADKAGSYLFDAIKDGSFGDAADKVGFLIEKLDEFKRTIETLALEGRIYEASQHIMDWTPPSLLNVVASDRSELDRFVRDIGDANTGMRYALSNLYNGLSGQNGVGGGRKLIDVWHDNTYKHLSDTMDAEYTDSTNVEEMDAKLAATFELIRNGLILLIMTTKGLTDAVYDDYPPALQLLKPAYDAGWTIGGWYRLMQRRSRNAWLVHDSSNGAVGYGSEDGDAGEWTFEPGPEDGLVGLATLNGDRLKLKSYYSTWSGYLETVWSGDTVVVFKLIPLTGSDDPVISLVGPFRESDGGPV